MLSIGIQSRGIMNENCLANSYKTIRQSGINCVDYNIILPVSRDLNIKDYYKHIENAKQNNLFISQTHAPLIPFTYERLQDKEYWDFFLEQYIKSIKITAILGAQYMVMHAMNMAEQVGRAEERRMNLLLFNALKPVAIEFNVMICIENIPLRKNGRSFDGVCSTAQSCLNYITDLNDVEHNCFGVCFDIGHANLLGKNVYDEVILLGAHLKVLHLHDNDGMYDQHQLPYSFYSPQSGEASIDWSGFLMALREIGYRGSLIFETGRFLSLLPGVLQSQALTLLYAIGENFSNIILFEEENLFPNKDRKIILFGAGKMLDVYMKLFGNKYPPLFVVDNCDQLWGTQKKGIDIHNPQKIKDIPKEERLLIICCGYYEEIILQLEQIQVNEYILCEEILRMNGKQG